MSKIIYLNSTSTIDVLQKANYMEGKSILIAHC